VDGVSKILKRWRVHSDVLFGTVHGILALDPSLVVLYALLILRCLRGHGRRSTLFLPNKLQANNALGSTVFNARANQRAAKLL
jgi:hypothetical protein